MNRRSATSRGFFGTATRDAIRTVLSSLFPRNPGSLRNGVAPCAVLGVSASLRLCASALKLFNDKS
jgi:hypothetical protein